MSDILIKGLEMPKACFESVDVLRRYPCPLLCYCRQRASYRQPDHDDVKATDCPLVEVPAHGRLVEESKTRRAITRELMNMRKGINPKLADLFDAIQTRCELVLTEAPTILEANYE